MQLSCSAFRQASSIPVRFTCDGENLSPALSWRGAPAETKSFALAMHDPDAPRAGGFTHWVLYNVPASATWLPSSLPREKEVSGICLQGKNDSGTVGYTGPCPPSGTHRYLIRLYALNEKLSLEAGASFKELKDAMHDHILEQAELMGTYVRAATAMKAA
jgi:Raf kinase inhibitor-like YbhB/YbcL family protein